MQYIIDFLGRFPFQILLGLSTTSVILGDYFAKAWSQSHRPLFIYLSMIGYLGSGLFYIPSLFKEGLIVTSLIWVIVSTAGFLFIGLVLFKETLTPWQIVGVIFGIISIIFLSIE